MSENDSFSLFSTLLFPEKVKNVDSAKKICANYEVATIVESTVHKQFARFKSGNFNQES